MKININQYVVTAILVAIVALINLPLAITHLSEMETLRVGDKLIEEARQDCALYSVAAVLSVGYIICFFIKKRK